MTTFLVDRFLERPACTLHADHVLHCNTAENQSDFLKCIQHILHCIILNHIYTKPFTLYANYGVKNAVSVRGRCVIPVCVYIYTDRHKVVYYYKQHSGSRVCVYSTGDQLMRFMRCLAGPFKRLYG